MTGEYTVILYNKSNSSNLGSDLSADLFLRFGEAFLRQFGSAVAVGDERLQVIHGLNAEQNIHGTVITQLTSLLGLGDIIDIISIP